MDFSFKVPLSLSPLKLITVRKILHINLLRESTIKKDNLKYTVQIISKVTPKFINLSIPK